jgi:hypothetical protein
MNLIVQNAFYGPLLLPAPPAPADDAPPLPVLPPVPLTMVSEFAQGLAKRAATRAGYEITGYVLTQKTRGAKCIVDGRDAAWLPGEQAKELLKWKRPKQDAPPAWVDDAPPETEDEGEQALRVLANRLGIPFNAMVPHNTGFFVPGIPNAYASAGDAIEALFERIYTAPDATVYRPGKPGRASSVVPPGVERIVYSNPLTPTQRVTLERELKPKTEPIEPPQMSMF